MRWWLRWKKLIVAGCALALTLAFTAWAVAHFVFDWIGRSTILDDAKHALGMLEQFLLWLFSTPWYVPALLATALTLLIFSMFFLAFLPELKILSEPMTAKLQGRKGELDKQIIAALEAPKPYSKDWDQVDTLRIWQIAYLWFGHEPLGGNIEPGMLEYPIEQMLIQAIEKEDLMADQYYRQFKTQQTVRREILKEFLKRRQIAFPEFLKKD